ncbi:MAG: hypothetical protein RLY93_05235 [Sumerlaeia bacterium]
MLRPPYRLMFLILVCSGAMALSGCAAGLANRRSDSRPDRELLDAAKRMEQNSRTWNVTHRGIAGRPWLGVNAEIVFRLEQLKALADQPDRFTPTAQETLDLMLAKGREDFVVGSAGLAQAPEMTRALAKQGIAEQSRLAALHSPEDRREWAQQLLDSAELPDTNHGKTLRMLATLPAVPFVKLWIANHAKHEWRGANWRDFAAQRLYEPDTSGDQAILDHLAGATEEELLQLYAPLIVQEIPGESPPDRRDDSIGRVGLIPDRSGDPVAEVDESQPTVYGHLTHAYVGGRWLTQLNYSFWYHDHPELKARDPEAGRAEGQLVRITLDATHRPLVSEAVYACGCYHRIYPLDDLEEAAKQAHGTPEQGDFVLARHIKGRIDPAIPETGGRFSPAQPHPVVWVRSGFHLIAAVRFTESVPAARETLAYDQLPSRDLELLPWGGETVSVFGKDGLVRGADRPEAALLFPSGMYHPGTPRIRGTHLIHFDQYRYTYPTLLEQMLRIPDKGNLTYDLAAYRHHHSADADRMRGEL